MLKTITQHLSDARKVLIAGDVDGSALDARLLLQAACELSHEEIIAEPDKIISAKQSAVFQNFITRRLGHEPVSRILNVREFYGRQFVVTPAVLDPRADTEALVDLVLERMNDQHQPSPHGGRWREATDEGLAANIAVANNPRSKTLIRPSGTFPQGGKDEVRDFNILDIGTGSGAIIITLLAERPSAHGVAVDLSQDALQVAKKNALRHGVSGRLQFHHGSWFEGVAGTFNLIVSNPPYIPHAEIAMLETDVKDYDPHLALDGGGDGLYAYRALAAGASAHLADQGFILVEIGAGQASDVTEIFTLHHFKLHSQKKDLSGHVRALAFQPC
jgi:release factor glutamine methyltransferase